MIKSYSIHNEDIENYAFNVFCSKDPVLEDVKKSTTDNKMPFIQVGDFDGLHLEVLTRMTKAKKAVEFGTLAGFSGICIARGLPEDGTLFTFELKKSFANTAKKNFIKAKVDHKVKQFVGPALENLSQIENQAPFDLVFIDADKTNYTEYFNWSARHLRSGGVVLADNTFGFGLITDKKFETESTRQSIEALRKFNQMAANDRRFKSTILPTGEGLVVAVKK